MTFDEVMQELERNARPDALEGMAKYGINVEAAFGVSIPNLRKIAKKAGTDHALAKELWKTGIHDARILATMIEDPARVTEAQMERWVKKFDSWDLCDQCCMNLFRKTPFAWKKAFEWATREEEYVKRASFALIATLAVHDKETGAGRFEEFLHVIEKASLDERNYVMKAVNWALRQIGKRDRRLNASAIRQARRLEKIDSKSAKWIAADALRELESAKVQEKLKR
jgi:3-methyladenine DNA glycosylase AlkD